MSDADLESKTDEVVVRHEVHIVGIRLPFWETVFNLLQLAVAAIPVIVVLTILAAVSYPLVLLFFGSFAH